MDTREIYRLAYRLARCHDRLLRWADRFASAHDGLPMLPFEILNRLDAIERHRGAYNLTRLRLVAAGLSWKTEVGGINDAAVASLTDRNDDHRSIMQRLITRFYIGDIQLLSREHAFRQRFLNAYALAVHQVRTARRCNPGRFQLRHHWLSRATSIGKGE